MDAVHLHLMLNHVPVIGTVLGVVLLAYALLRKQEQVMSASLGLFVVTGVVAVVAYLTGEEAEERIEGMAGVSEALIHPHEEIAEVALWAAVALGVVSLGALFWKRRSLPTWATGLVLVGAIVVAGLMGRTAYLGGQIRHPEIRSDAPSALPALPSAEDDD